MVGLDDDLESVESAVARVTSDGQWGTGSFIKEHVLLTCGHVVGAKGSAVDVEWTGNRRTGTVRSVFQFNGARYDLPDLAIIDVERKPRPWHHGVITLGSPDD